MHVRIALASIACLVLAAPAAADGGLAIPDGQVVWPQVQARMATDAPLLMPLSLAATSNPSLGLGLGLSTSRLLGDFYFGPPGLQLPASMGGLRATSGLIGETRATAQSLKTEILPYLGLGYTSQTIDGRWGITADFGLALENPGSASRAGRALLGNQGFEQAMREIRLSPMLQLGVSYAF